jgi:hypothetical protein
LTKFASVPSFLAIVSASLLHLIVSYKEKKVFFYNRVK